MAMVEKVECFAWTSSGGRILPTPGIGCALPTGTYYFTVSTPDAPTASVHLAWSSTLVASSIVFQDTNLPRFLAYDKPDSGDDVNDWSTVAGAWLTENPSTAYVPIVGTGASVSAMTIALTGGSVGGAMLNLGNLGSRRGRIAVVVTTAGILRVVPWGKSG
jgi:hypothetical protein